MKQKGLPTNSKETPMGEGAKATPERFVLRPQGRGEASAPAGKASVIIPLKDSAFE
jgi:hypothetical protein